MCQAPPDAMGSAPVTAKPDLDHGCAEEPRMYRRGETIAPTEVG